LLDGIILTKNTGLTVAGGALSLEKAIEQRILNSIERTRNLAKVDFFI
jgi:signal recognition particle GTPase